MRTGGPRSRFLGTAAPFVIAGALMVGAGAAIGFEPGGAAPIPEQAFQPVVLPSRFPVALAPSPHLRPLFDAALQTDPPVPRAQPSLPAASPVIVPVATPRPAATTTHSISGRASWYCRAGVSPCTMNHPDESGFNAYAAAGPRLRRALGADWRGSIVYVDGIRVKLIDWCQCYEGESNEKLLDLYYDVFARVGSTVRIRW